MWGEMMGQQWNALEILLLFTLSTSGFQFVLSALWLALFAPPLEMESREGSIPQRGQYLAAFNKGLLGKAEGDERFRDYP